MLGSVRQTMKALPLSHPVSWSQSTSFLNCKYGLERQVDEICHVKYMVSLMAIMLMPRPWV